MTDFSMAKLHSEKDFKLRFIQLKVLFFPTLKGQLDKRAPKCDRPGLPNSHIVFSHSFPRLREKMIMINPDSSEKAVRDLLAIEDLDIEALDRMLRELTSRITIKNNSGDVRWVRISKGGDTGIDAFFGISPGDTKSWKRGLARRITIEMSNNDNSSGVASTPKRSVFI
jgi:hypothetical protein